MTPTVRTIMEFVKNMNELERQLFIVEPTLGTYYIYKFVDEVRKEIRKDIYPAEQL